MLARNGNDFTNSSEDDPFAYHTYCWHSWEKQEYPIKVNGVVLQVGLCPKVLHDRIADEDPLLAKKFVVRSRSCWKLIRFFHDLLDAEDGLNINFFSDGVEQMHRHLVENSLLGRTIQIRFCLDFESFGPGRGSISAAFNRRKGYLPDYKKHKHALPVPKFTGESFPWDGSDEQFEEILKKCWGWKLKNCFP